jgi:hypothetical protein
METISSTSVTSLKIKKENKTPPQKLTPSKRKSDDSEEVRVNPLHKDWTGAEDTQIEEELGKLINKLSPMINPDMVEILTASYAELKERDNNLDQALDELNDIEREASSLTRQNAVLKQQLEDMNESRLLDHNDFFNEKDHLSTMLDNMNRDLRTQDQELVDKQNIIYDLESRIKLLTHIIHKTDNKHSEGPDSDEPDLLKQYLYPTPSARIYYPPVGLETLGAFTLKQLFMLSKMCSDKEIGLPNPFHRFLTHFNVHDMLDEAEKAGHGTLYDELSSSGLNVHELFAFWRV